MSVDVSIQDIHIDEIIENMHSAAEIALDAAGMQAASAAKRELQNNPSRIDTGLLRNSVTHAVGGKMPAITEYSADNPSKYDKKTPPPGGYSGNAPEDPEGQTSAYIGTNVEYAGYVHEGTTRMTPNRFLKNAVEQNQSQLAEIIAKVLRETST